MTYGCHNKPRPIAGEIIKGSPFYGSQEWPFANSTECKHDIRRTDPGCSGCDHSCVVISSMINRKDNK